MEYCFMAAQLKSFKGGGLGSVSLPHFSFLKKREIFGNVFHPKMGVSLNRCDVRGEKDYKYIFLSFFKEDFLTKCLNSSL